MTTIRKTWADRLDPFARLYATMEAGISADLEAMTDAELSKTLAATRRPTQTNAWWATYAVAPIVAELVREERERRRMARKEAR